MVKKCIYCGKEVIDERVVDFCDKCGIGIWGEKMFGVIIQSMEEARDKGNLYPMNPELLKDTDSKKFYWT